MKSGTWWYRIELADPAVSADPYTLDFIVIPRWYARWFIKCYLWIFDRGKTR